MMLDAMLIGTIVLLAFIYLPIGFLLTCITYKEVFKHLKPDWLFISVMTLIWPVFIITGLEWADNWFLKRYYNRNIKNSVT